jgi:hypothetical protein
MRKLLAYFGHHKCATQWMKAILAEVCTITGRELVVHSGPRTFGGDLGAAIPDPEGTVLCYVNADRHHVDTLGPLRGFHIVRDPRDIVVSAYFSHLYSHPEYLHLAEYREQLRSVSEEEGLLLEIDKRRHEFRMMFEWDYERPDILELRMEDVTVESAPAVSRILSFLGLGADDGLDQATVAAIVERNAFEAKAGRAPGTEDVRSHYRKGVAGDWVEHFTERHVEYFKDHYNDLLLKLGYEDDPDWDRRLRAVDPGAAV